MEFTRAEMSDFDEIRGLYHHLIDVMGSEKIGWKKGIYPSDEYLIESVGRGELYILRDRTIKAAVILNSERNEGYEGVNWHISCADNEVLTPHALAVSPECQGQGLGKRLVGEMINTAKNKGMRAVRLDILTGNDGAERLYRSAGFIYVCDREMYYEDTGTTKYSLFEYVLDKREHM